VVQPGLPEAPGGTRLADAALRFDGGELEVGPVTLGGAAAPDALLHVVWQEGAGPRTVALADQLLAPWAEIADLIAEAPAASSSLSVREESPLAASADILAEIVRGAALYRLQRRARAIGLRQAAVGGGQLLWELLAEALGYHRNQAPFRHLARRLPLAFLQPLDAEERMALLFGVAGLLPAGDVQGISPQARAVLGPLWDRWWKARAALDYAVLPAGAWCWTQIRPANRPERRLAALALLAPQMERLERAVAHRDAAAFARVLSECHDPFWSRHATWKSRPSAKPSLLLGGERIGDLVLNLFLPLVFLDDPAAAEALLATLPAGENRVPRAVRARLPEDFAGRRPGGRGALLQQGLLQLHRDAPDAAALRRIVAGWSQTARRTA
jgi:hypothetical protein